METTIVYWGYIGIIENKMETTILWGSGIRLQLYDNEYHRTRAKP